MEKKEEGHRATRGGPFARQIIFRVLPPDDPAMPTFPLIFQDVREAVEYCDEHLYCTLDIGLVDWNAA